MINTLRSSVASNNWASINYQHLASLTTLLQNSSIISGGKAKHGIIQFTAKSSVNVLGTVFITEFWYWIIWLDSFFTQWDILDLHVIARGTWHLQSLMINMCILPELKAQLDTFLSPVWYTVHLVTVMHINVRLKGLETTEINQNLKSAADKANSTPLGFISF